MRKKAKPTKKNKKMRKIARVHAIFSFSIFSLYIILSSVYSPEFLFSDVRSKFSALADGVVTITAKVLGPPMKPIAVVYSQCANGQFSTMIDWPDDENSSSFDISRDNSLLITSLSASQYNDSAITPGTSYTYTVTAHGEMGPGIAVSNAVSIKTPINCNVPLPAPSVVINSFESKSVASYKGKVTTEKQKPLFTGDTNIPNAIIKLSIRSSTNIVSETIANVNGYWSWRAPISISEGSYNVYVTAIGPNDKTQITKASLNFSITTSISTPVQKNKILLPAARTALLSPITQSDVQQQAGASVSTESHIEPPLALSFVIEDKVVLPGEHLGVLAEIKKLAPQHDEKIVQLNYRIFDEKGNEVIPLTAISILDGDLNINKEIPLPLKISEGTYRFQIEILTSDGYSISKEEVFIIKPLPILSLGGGIIVTYPEFLSKLGTIAISLLLALIVWLFLFYREYWLYLHALRNITEKNFEKLGLISIKQKRRASK